MSFTKGAGRFRNAPALTTVGLIAAAAMLVVAAPAMGAADPLKGGTTTLNFKSLKVSKASGGATKAGKKSAELPITGGSLDPTNGSGPVENGGKLKVKKGKKSTTLKKIKTTFGPGGSIVAKVGKKNVKLATLTGGTVGRAGFGGTVDGANAKLTKKGAKALNKALHTSSFKKGKKLAGANTTTVPSTVAIKSGASVTTEAVASFPGCNPNCPYAVKAAVDGFTPTGGTLIASDGAAFGGTPTAPTLTFTPQTGGSVAPDCSGGTMTGSQGKIAFNNQAAYPGKQLTQASPNDEFGNKVVSFEATSTLVAALPGGPLGRAPATVLDLSGATCTADPANHKITITNVVQTVGAAAAKVANDTFGFTNGGPCGPGNCPLAGGDLIGTTAYDITTQ